MHRDKEIKALDIEDVDKRFWQLVKLEKKYRQFFVREGKRNAGKVKH